MNSCGVSSLWRAGQVIGVSVCLAACTNATFAEPDRDVDGGPGDEDTALHDGQDLDDGPVIPGDTLVIGDAMAGDTLGGDAWAGDALTGDTGANGGDSSETVYPRPPVVYQPDYPPLGSYSLPGRCSAIHDGAAAKVTLQDNESLQEGYTRLREASGDAGGVLEVPWDVATVQCDNLRLIRNQIMDVPNFTLKGLPGPEGQQPRFYCRRDTRDGNVTKADVTSEFLSIGEDRASLPEGGTISVATHQQVVVENLHIDGYPTAIGLPGSGKIILRNNYIHHQTNNGIVFGNLDWAEPTTMIVEICGNEISHSGSSNTKHGLYLHRGFPTSPDQGLVQGNVTEVYFLDNLCHSTPYSSCLKSIANINVVVGNRFHQSLDTDPSYTKRYSSLLIDLAACAINTIDDNEIHGHKPEATSYGDSLVAIRNRRSIFGCDRPLGYVGETYSPTATHEGPFWTSAYWTSLAGATIMPTTITNNLFVAGPDFGDRLHAITDYGTYPNAALAEFSSWSQWLETPALWYERHRTAVSNNTYQGFTDGQYYRNSTVNHCPPEVNNCPSPAPAGPGPNNDMIDVGSGEVYQ